jgi:hypothetical protein
MNRKEDMSMKLADLRLRAMVDERMGMAKGGRVSIFDAPAKRMAGGGRASIFDTPVKRMSEGGSSGEPTTKAIAKALGELAVTQGKEEFESFKKPRAATDIGNRGILAPALGLPVDTINMGLSGIDALTGLMGKPTRLSSEKPFAGSEHIKDLMDRYGVTSGEDRPMTETMLSLFSPAGMVKGAMNAPKIAQKASNAIKGGLEMLPKDIPVGMSIKDVGKGSVKSMPKSTSLLDMTRTPSEAEIQKLSREDLINWLQRNDPNGQYLDPTPNPSFNMYRTARGYNIEDADTGRVFEFGDYNKAKKEFDALRYSDSEFQPMTLQEAQDSALNFLRESVQPVGGAKVFQFGKSLSEMTPKEVALAKMREMRPEFKQKADLKEKYDREMDNKYTRDMPSFEDWKAKQTKKARGGLTLVR